MDEFLEALDNYNELKADLAERRRNNESGEDFEYHNYYAIEEVNAARRRTQNWLDKYIDNRIEAALNAQDRKQQQTKMIADIIEKELHRALSMGR